MLLPPNATKQEKALVDATDYKVDIQKGFKFSLKEETLPWIIEEYGLEGILRWVKDRRKAVVEGVKFQRLRGTPASLKIALKWANIEDITIIEEPPGKHFFELQIGIRDVPNIFRFSGISIKVIESYLRNHYEQTFSNDIYRLDVAVLGETEPHTKDYKGIYERDHLWYNLKALYPLPQSLLPEIKFAKAQIVLSDSSNLGEINACFPVGSVEERGNKFVLGSDKLSGQHWSLKHKPILERFSIIHRYKVENYTDQKVRKYGLAEHNIYYKNDLDSEQKGSIHELENDILVFYPGVLKWHEHRHLHRSWKDSQAICVIS